MDEPISSGSAYGLTNAERETIINYNNADATANVYSLNQPMRRRILALAEEYPEDVKITRLEDDSIEAEIPKGWVKIRPPRKLTDEQREALVERGRALAEKYLKNKEM